MMYDNGSEFKLHFRALCKTYGVKRKTTSIKNPQANAMLERIHAVFTNMLHTAKLDKTKSVNANDINIFLADAAWAICSTHHTVLKASPGAAIFG
jgi:transposase InsO family protein